ncbi:hypothetical protein GWI33_004924 [Rhynchophorus ferrugineus]|uniref:Uncharacterized protein n=1 Tax=Rhynchophorus ferrugineus TaxID=354439 RepID=A0A834IWW3_RHYFE|nr:hypothetical protein GWI33_004924 [Rhynchophorus ferrugineus]
MSTEDGESKFNMFFNQNKKISPQEINRSDLILFDPWKDEELNNGGRRSRKDDPQQIPIRTETYVNLQWLACEDRDQLV